MREITIKPPTDAPMVMEYKKRFGHLPAIEAMKWMSPQQLEKAAEQALKENKPIKEWAERANKKMDSVLDEAY